MNIFQFWQSWFNPPQDSIVALTDELNQLRVTLISITGALSEDYREAAEALKEAKANNVPISELQVNLGEELGMRKALNRLHGIDFLREILDTTLECSPALTLAKEVEEDKVSQSAITKWVLMHVNLIDEALIKPEDKFESIGWDIGKIVDLILLAEEHFGIEIPDHYTLQIETIEDFIELIYVIKSAE